MEREATCRQRGRTRRLVTCGARAFSFTNWCVVSSIADRSLMLTRACVQLHGGKDARQKRQLENGYVDRVEAPQAHSRSPSDPPGRPLSASLFPGIHVNGALRTSDGRSSTKRATRSRAPCSNAIRKLGPQPARSSDTGSSPPPRRPPPHQSKSNEDDGQASRPCYVQESCLCAQDHIFTTSPSMMRPLMRADIHHRVSQHSGTTHQHAIGMEGGVLMMRTIRRT
jgi:hypothetical protein